MSRTRREVLAGLGAMGLGSAVPGLVEQALGAPAGACPFRVSVINDEIGDDFERSCKVAAEEFGLSWIELRSLWGKALADLSQQQLNDAKKLLTQYKLRVTDLASPLFKVDWPGAPKTGVKSDEFHSDPDNKKQDALLEKLIPIAHFFATDRIRCFDFLRLPDPKPYRAAINAKLLQAAERCKKDNIILVMENEMTCNTGDGVEAAATLAAVQHPNFMLNWDPGNAVALDEVPFPTGYAALPKNRIGHCHVKNGQKVGPGKYEWLPVDEGVVDWAGQFRALAKDGYHYAVSLETHWHGGGGPEASSRRSMQGMKKRLGEAGLNC